MVLMGSIILCLIENISKYSHNNNFISYKNYTQAYLQLILLCIWPLYRILWDLTDPILAMCSNVGI